MIVALFVLALLMLIGGLAAVVQGIPFVRLEVGWTMVIAGTVGANGGAVLLGITAVVARLGRIERALTTRTATAVADTAPAEPRGETAPARPVRSEPVMTPALTPAMTPALTPAMAPATRPDSPPVLPPIPFPAAAPPAPGMHPTETRSAEPAGLGGGTALATGAAAAAGFAAGELRLTRAEDTDPLPTTHDPAPPEADRRETAPHAPLEEPRAEAIGLQDAAPPPPEPAPVSEPAREEVRLDELTEEEFLEEPPAKTVIGTYDSGGNTYTMYADGTIDAETPAGRFHFASIDELKAFRTAGGEGAARSA